MGHREGPWVRFLSSCVPTSLYLPAPLLHLRLSRSLTAGALVLQRRQHPSSISSASPKVGRMAMSLLLNSEKVLQSSKDVKRREREKGVMHQTPGHSTSAPALPSCVTLGKALSLSEVARVKWTSPCKGCAQNLAPSMGLFLSACGCPDQRPGLAGKVEAVQSRDPLLNSKGLYILAVWPRDQTSRGFSEHLSKMRNGSTYLIGLLEGLN